MPPSTMRGSDLLVAAERPGAEPVDVEVELTGR